MGWTLCDHDSAAQRGEDKTAIRESIQRFGPERGAEASLAIIENGGSLEKRHRIRSSAMLALRLPFNRNRLKAEKVKCAGSDIFAA
jgi:hypothetical protein